jgi:hypothetical protein
MTPIKAQSIKTWIKRMGFKLTKRHVSTAQSKKINYYTLDNFGIYEEISSSAKKTQNESPAEKQRFISWTPWGIDFEIKSVRDLSRAYEEFLKYNPSVAVN